MNPQGRRGRSKTYAELLASFQKQVTCFREEVASNGRLSSPSGREKLFESRVQPLLTMIATGQAMLNAEIAIARRAKPNDTDYPRPQYSAACDSAVMLILSGINQVVDVMHDSPELPKQKAILACVDSVIADVHRLSRKSLRKKAEP